MKWMLAVGLVTLLSSCPQNLQMGGGQARVLSNVSQPNLSTCTLIRSYYIAIKGENFGVAADWESGANKVIFFDKVVVPVSEATLTQGSNPATLIVKVPTAAQSGPLVLEVAGVKSAPVEVTVADIGASNAVGTCEFPAPPR